MHLTDDLTNNNIVFNCNQFILMKIQKLKQNLPYIIFQHRLLTLQINRQSQMNPAQQRTAKVKKQMTQRWIASLVLVTFDIDQGQKVQHMIPQIQLSQQTKKQLAMLSFPDSNSFNDYQNSFKYTFRMFNGLFGYTCFKQKKDPSNPRGFSQRSFVILSELPFIDFFQKMSEFIVFKTFNSVSDEQFPTIMNNICQQISNWPDPIPKQLYKLPLLQYQLDIQIPNYKFSKQRLNRYNRMIQDQKIESSLSCTNKQFNLKNILNQQQLLREGPFQQIKLNQIFINCHEAIWAIWQGIMLNSSVLLLGSNPHQVSHAVLGAISLIYPFQYCGNYNPYITVYDPNLDKIAAADKNWIMGGTNPLFSKFFNKDITQIITLDKKFKCAKNLNPLTQLLLKSGTQQQHVINQLSIRKYFYQLSKSVMTIFDIYLNQQINNLKFFNEQNFFKYLKDRKDYLSVEDAFTSKKYVIQFFEKFVKSNNFNQYLLDKNAIKSKQK